ncbi:MFS transporter [Cellulomonas sp. S1-8]|uniref:MFS transporter n=1 Tax=Cellulomonas sp. S1-8 TaxID=2904790 RepID=UPI002244A958|nr:MFS transporter [Cellulomonas sp. S1-8]UZN04153.1 MFS transporter [Cellulomonas sp. S1-8]
MRRRLDPGSGRALLLVFLFVGADTLMQTLLPLSLEAAGAASPAVIGVMVAVVNGIGLVTALPASAYGDRRGRRRVIRVAAGVGVTAAVGMAAVHDRSSLWFWLLPILVYGLVRVAMMAALLAEVTTSGRPVEIQGLNSLAQRGAAALAAAAAAALIAQGAWAVGMVAAAVCLALMLPVVKAPLGRSLTQVGPTPGEAFGFGWRLVSRERAVLGSSLVALCSMALFVVGNSFFALAIGGDIRGSAGLVAAFLVSRDATSIVLSPLLGRIVRRIGLTAAVLGVGVCGAAGLALLVVAPQHVPVVVLSAALQGVSVSLCIATTNLLAMATVTDMPSGPSVRVAAMSAWPSLGGLVLPVVLGVLLEVRGAGLMFLASACLVLATGCTAWWLVRHSVLAEPEPAAPLSRAVV